MATPRGDGVIGQGGDAVQFSPDELECLNLRMLSSIEKTRQKTFFMPRERQVSLLCIRFIYTRLLQQRTEKDNGREDAVSAESARRAFERLFHVVEDPNAFNLDVDKNKDGFISWGEFFHLYRTKEITIRVSIFERIYLTFDDPDSSYLAQIVSLVVLFTIITSSLSFIIGTLPECQFQEPALSKPKPVPAFGVIEEVCLILFVIEYVARLLTVWAVRDDLIDEQRLLDFVTGFQPAQRASPFWRLVRFLVTPSNVVDLAAILPGLLSTVIENGEGFVVLRLIRLTRIFRAFKIPALSEPVIVISRTMTQSTKALYFLVFNLLLGVMIFGSLMYLAEGASKWDEVEQVFMRRAGKTWNFTSLQWEETWEPSPFVSIPHTFWWALVTATTVGYGDENNFPKTPFGKIVAVVTMIFSLVILALPVGVIGGTFIQVWDHYKIERKKQLEENDKEMTCVTSAVQRLEPWRLCPLLMLEVWHDTHPNSSIPRQQEAIRRRPPTSHFLGQAILRLDLPGNGQTSREVRLTLHNDGEPVKRCIAGSVTVRYSWKPHQDDQTRPRSTQHFDLMGQLNLTVVQADGLVNLNFAHRWGASNPYCTLLCYPESPKVGQLTPCIWRTKTITGTCNPQWSGETRRINFAWFVSKESTDEWGQRENGTGTITAAGTANGNLDDLMDNVLPPVKHDAKMQTGFLGASAPAKVGHALRIMRELNDGLDEVRGEVGRLQGLVHHLSLQAAASGITPGSKIPTMDLDSSPPDEEAC